MNQPATPKPVNASNRCPRVTRAAFAALAPPPLSLIFFRRRIGHALCCSAPSRSSIGAYSSQLSHRSGGLAGHCSRPDSGRSYFAVRALEGMHDPLPGASPRILPGWLGLRSENARASNRRRMGTGRRGLRKVFSFRAETRTLPSTNFLVVSVPWHFHKGSFDGDEAADQISLTIYPSRRPRKEARFKGRVGRALSETSLFDTVEQAASFFSLGATGYSATHKEVITTGWSCAALDWHVSRWTLRTHIPAAFRFEALSEGSVELDCALVMRNIEHEWHSRPDLYYDPQKRRLSPQQPSAA